MYWLLNLLLNIITLVCYNIIIKSIETLIINQNYYIIVLGSSSFVFYWFIDNSFSFLLILLSVLQCLSFICLLTANENIKSKNDNTVITLISRSNGIFITFISNFVFNLKFDFFNLFGNLYILSGIYLVYFNSSPYHIINTDEENQLDEALINTEENSFKSKKYIIYSVIGLSSNVASLMMTKVLLINKMKFSTIIFYKQLFSLFIFLFYFQYKNQTLIITFRENKRLVDKAFGIFLILLLTIFLNLNFYFSFLLYDSVNNIGYIKSLESISIIIEIILMKYVVRIDDTYNNIVCGLATISFGNLILLGDMYIYKRII